MHFSSVIAVSAFGSVAMAKEMAVDQARATELYTSDIQHERLMANKLVCRAEFFECQTVTLRRPEKLLEPERCRGIPV